MSLTRGHGAVIAFPTRPTNAIGFRVWSGVMHAAFHYDKRCAYITYTQPPLGERLRPVV